MKMIITVTVFFGFGDFLQTGQEISQDSMLSETWCSVHPDCLVSCRSRWIWGMFNVAFNVEKLCSREAVVTVIATAILQSL